MSLFSKNLRFLRKKGNHNQDEISILFNKRANTIGNWENQKSEPSLAELIKLGEYFKVSIQELLHADLEMQSFQQIRVQRFPTIHGQHSINLILCRSLLTVWLMKAAKMHSG